MFGFLIIGMNYWFSFCSLCIFDIFTIRFVSSDQQSLGSVKILKSHTCNVTAAQVAISSGILICFRFLKPFIHQDTIEVSEDVTAGAGHVAELISGGYPTETEAQLARLVESSLVSKK